MMILYEPVLFIGAWLVLALRVHVKALKEFILMKTLLALALLVASSAAFADM
jgi:hypothetical protein